MSYLDGAIMVPPPMVGQPGSVFLYSGSREVSTSTGDAARAIADGHGGKSYLAVYEVFKKAAS
ncbi:hypothetical protein [Amycolatopsis sp. 3B14]|uniref:hypothetical protein n=1 Tax=Amycolatopsis sp. 3B14 TaxID=3243600 RepID=UPI003D995C71